MVTLNIKPIPRASGFIITDRKEKNIMKLTGYYMTAICKFEDGIKTICVVDAQNRAQLLNLAGMDGVV